eukprot:1985937-Pyramimonas_sp.AAC.1
MNSKSWTPSWRHAERDGCVLKGVPSSPRARVHPFPFDFFQTSASAWFYTLYPHVTLVRGRTTRRTGGKRQDWVKGNKRERQHVFRISAEVFAPVRMEPCWRGPMEYLVALCPSRHRAPGNPGTGNPSESPAILGNPCKMFGLDPNLCNPIYLSGLHEPWGAPLRAEGAVANVCSF